MESIPSFSLGITQLDEQTLMENLDGNYSLINLILGVFHNKEKYFHENRFKHRNNPSVMKKLLEKSTSNQKNQ